MTAANVSKTIETKMADSFRAEFQQSQERQAKARVAWRELAHQLANEQPFSDDDWQLVGALADCLEIEGGHDAIRWDASQIKIVQAGEDSLSSPEFEANAIQQRFDELKAREKELLPEVARLNKEIAEIRWKRSVFRPETMKSIASAKTQAPRIYTPEGGAE